MIAGKNSGPVGPQYLGDESTYNVNKKYKNLVMSGTGNLTNLQLTCIDRVNERW